MVKKGRSPIPRSSSKTGSKPPREEEKICFTIMPFGGYYDVYYEKIYYPAIEASGLAPKRADDVFRPGTITTDIWTFLNHADVVLADLSDKRPNVFYELGLAHALRKPTILVSQSMEDVPFDLRGMRVIIYDKNLPDWGEVLRSDLVSSISETLVSPQSAMVPAFMSLKLPTAPNDELTDTDRQLLEIRRDMEFVKNQLIAMDELAHPGLMSGETTNQLMKLYTKSAASLLTSAKPDRRQTGLPEGSYVTQLDKAMRNFRAHTELSVATPPTSESEKPE